VRSRVTVRRREPLTICAYGYSVNIRYGHRIVVIYVAAAMFVFVFGIATSHSIRLDRR
jgi:hypothetical protein